MLALAVCVATVVAVKYLQLFFPPRTVTLNYVTAQTLGSLAGCAGFAVWHDRIAPTFTRRKDPIAALVVALRLYLAALLVFLLMPLDFALNGPDLAAQIHRLPDTLAAIPGWGRSLPVRVLVLGASVAAFVPVGMLLSFVRVGHHRVQRSLGAVTLLGLLLTAGSSRCRHWSSAPVRRSSPSFTARLGIILGAAALRWLVRQELVKVRAWAAAAVPWLIVPYLLALAFANQLVSTEWRTWQRALAETYSLGWLPLFDYYIVTKAEAAKNVVGHVLMYLPVGVAVWLRGPRAGRGALAFALGALLSLVVEAGRYLRPGLEGDINAVAVGGVAAMLAIPLMDHAWSLLAEMVRRRRWGSSPGRSPAGTAARETFAEGSRLKPGDAEQLLRSRPFGELLASAVHAHLNLPHRV